MAANGVDVLLLSVGSDLPYLSGYEAMPLERLTMLVVPRDGEATLVVPRLEAPRVDRAARGVHDRPWDETDDPVAIVAGLVGRARRGRRGRHDVGPVPGRAARRTGRRPRTQYVRCDDGDERPAHAQGRRRDRRAPGRRRRGRPGRGAAARRRDPAGRAHRGTGVSADISARLLAEGHDIVNFAIVAAGENAASPHHHAGERVIREGEVVLMRLRRHHGRLLQRHHPLRVAR